MILNKQDLAIMTDGQLLLVKEGVEIGVLAERERIIELLDIELNNCQCETPLTHLDARIRDGK